MEVILLKTKSLENEMSTRSYKMNMKDKIQKKGKKKKTETEGEKINVINRIQLQNGNV